MRITTPVSTGAAAVLWGALVVAASPTPAPVASALREFTGICTEVGGKALTTDAIKRADLSGDGNEDYILDVGSVHCDGAASVYGDREK